MINYKKLNKRHFTKNNKKIIKELSFIDFFMPLLKLAMIMSIVPMLLFISLIINYLFNI